MTREQATEWLSRRHADPDQVTAVLDSLPAALFTADGGVVWNGLVRAEGRLFPVLPATTPCPPWCAGEPGHGYVDITTDGRPSRLHYLEGGGDPSVDLIADETVQGDGTVVLEPPRLVVWIEGNPVDKDMTGPEVLSLAEGLSRAATPAVAAWVEATREHGQVSLAAADAWDGATNA